MSRKPFTETDALREKVRSLAAVGVPQDDIAKIVDCSPKTLRKHFRRELDRAAAETNAAVAGFLFKSAKDGNVAAQIFWMKTRAHWKETTAHEVAGPDGEPVPSPNPVIILPDNGRDPELLESVLVHKGQAPRLRRLLGLRGAR
jgi:hypothetical protein